MTTRYCDSCGQPVLRTDATCWHCGAPLGPVPPPAVPEEGDGPDAPAARASHEPYAFVYVGLTAVVALAFLLVTVALGRRPLLLQGVTGGAGDWVAISDAGGRYRVNIPAEWTWMQARNADAQAALAARAGEDPQLKVALLPLSHLISDSELLLLAEGDQAFFLLARSTNLAGLDSSELQSALRAESFAGSAVASVDGFQNDAGQDGLLLEVDQLAPPLSCRQIVLPGQSWGYLGAACTAQPARGQDEQFQTLLTSLQIRD